MARPSAFAWTVDPQTRIELKPGFFKRRMMVNGTLLLKQALSTKKPIQFELPDGRSGALVMQSAMGGNFQPELEMKVAGQVVLSDLELTQRACLACGQKAKLGDEFCERCGKPLPEPAVQRQVIRLNNSRRSIAVVAWLFILSGAAMALLSNVQAQDALKKLEGYEASATYPEPIDGETMTVGQLRAELQREPWQVLGLNIFLAAVMFGLYYYARLNPLVGLIAALGVFLAVQVGNVILEPATLAQGIWIKILVPVMLGSGIRTAWQLRKLKA
jgi:hypothetical protein